jgi:pimeloyl-ACP methyl ester carboxylesterase
VDITDVPGFWRPDKSIEGRGGPRRRRSRPDLVCREFRSVLSVVPASVRHVTTFVLVPGFWLGSWAWDEVAVQLRSRGHEVIALTPAGVAERAVERDATIESRVAEVRAELRGHRDVVLAGHSGAGVVVAAAAERAREHVARVVFVDTGPLPEGMSYLDFVPPEVARSSRAQMAERGGQLPMPDRAGLAANGVRTDGIDDATFECIRVRATPEPEGTVSGTARRAEPDRSLPKTVIACSFTEAAARAAIEAGVLGFAEMGGPEWSFVELPTGHWPMFSVPGELAAVLARLT